MAGEPSQRRLNPFAFPSEAELRTLLLIFAILGLCWNVGFFFATALADRTHWPALQEIPRLERDIWHIESDRPFLPTAEQLAREEQALFFKLSSLNRREEQERAWAELHDLRDASWRQLGVALFYLVIPSAFLLMMVLIVPAYYWAGLFRQKFLARSSVLSPDDEPALYPAVQGLIAEAAEAQSSLGDAPPPPVRILLTASGYRGEGRTDGLLRPRMVLSRSLRLFLRKDLAEHEKPFRVRAIVLHELAHLVNRDVARTCWAEASRVILALVSLLLVGALGLRPFAGPTASALDEHPMLVPLQAIVLLLAVELVRRGLLRDREHYADLRAGLLWHAGEPLRAVLSEAAAQPAARSKLVRRCTRLWSKHPPHEERRRVLDDSNPLFEVRGEIPLLTGLWLGNLLVAILLLSVVIVPLVQAASMLATLRVTESYAATHGLKQAMFLYYQGGGALQGSLAIPLWLALLVAGSYLMAGTLGIQIQRQVAAHAVLGYRELHPYRDLLPPALLAAFGLEAGLLLAPLTPAVPARLLGWLGVLSWLVLATFLLWLWLVVTRYLALRVLATSPGAGRPVRRRRLLTLLATLHFFAALSALLGGQFWIWPRMTIVDASHGLGMIAGGLFVFLVMAALTTFAVGAIQVFRTDRAAVCSSCGEPVSGATLGVSCWRCGKSLSPWLVLGSGEPGGPR